MDGGRGIENIRRGTNSRGTKIKNLQQYIREVFDIIWTVF
jgi:predicted enzyme involved in methoxymalonyl-ACP biosynthesis